MLTIDLNAPSISNAQRVWRLFPGQHYQFLNFFRETGLGFLDIPGFQMPEGRLSAATDLIARVAASKATKDALISRPQMEPLIVSPADVQPARTTKFRGRIRQAVINLYEEAAENDLVVLPSPIYMSDVFIGRIRRREGLLSAKIPRYGETLIPAIPIDWLATAKENSISGQLSSSLRNQHPFTLLERSLYVEVFSIVYSSFVYNNMHVSTIFNKLSDYVDSDSSLLGNISRLASAACRSIEENRGGIGGDLLDVILFAPPIEFTCSQDIYVRSPGFSRYRSATIASLVIAAFVATLIGLSALNSKEEIAAEVAHIQVINSSVSADPDCTAGVSDATNRIIASLDIDKTWHMCQEIKASRARSGMDSSAKPKLAKPHGH